MTARIITSLSTATVALIAATPALAQQEMSYEERVYEYARPAGEVVQQPVPVESYPQQPVIFTDQPVVQSVPAHTPHAPMAAPAPAQTVRYIKGPAHQPAPVQTVQYVERAPAVRYVERPVQHTREVEYETEQVVYAAPPAPHQAQYAPAHAGPVYAPAQQHASYDREAWLDDCRDRISGRRRGSNGGIIGGLLGAIAGGGAGNRIYDGERLAGTLIGAGVGGLAGLAIGSLIGGSGDRRDSRAYDECEDYLARWEYQQQHGYQYGHGQYGYAQQGYVMREVLVAVPQRAVVREYMSTEIVTEYVEVQETAPVQYTPAPAPAPRPQGKRQRYRKGN